MDSHIWDEVLALSFNACPLGPIPSCLLGSSLAQLSCGGTKASEKCSVSAVSPTACKNKQLSSDQCSGKIRGCSYLLSCFFTLLFPMVGEFPFLLSI